MTRDLKFATLGGLLVTFADTTAEQTGILPGALYKFTAHGGMALVRWGASDAATSDAGWDFAVGDGETVYARAPASTTAFNVIEANAGSAATATLAVSRVDEGV
jgi:hypothetical protein